VGKNAPGDGFAWAVLNVASTSGSGTPIRAFKLVDVRPLPAPPLSAALGDLTADGVPDLIVGAAVADVGLMTLRIEKEPMCTPATGGSPKPCGQFQKLSEVAKGTIFAYKDGQNLLDVCVGETARGIVSCYRNVTHDGKLAQAQDSYTFTDAGDTHSIVAAEFSSAGGDGPDLIVQSTTGKFVRWLTGDHNGGFKFVENQVPSRNIYGLGCSRLGVGAVGPQGFAGKPFLTAITDQRKVSIIPTQLDDHSHALQCFRSWVLGVHLTQVEVADLNADGAPDLVALDADQPGLTVAFGQLNDSGGFSGNFLAPDAHHVCAQDRGGHGNGVWNVGEALLSDYDGDKKLDLTVIGDAGGAVSGAPCGESPIPLVPTWTFALYENTPSGVLNPQPRQAEYSPMEQAESGQPGDCEAMGTVSVARGADINGDNIPDIVTTRKDASYFLGSQAPCDCCFDEAHEVANDYGPTVPPEPISGCTVPTAGNCKNYDVPKDPCYTHPILGYGGGAPQIRASTAIFLSGAKGPLDVPVSCTVGAGCLVTPVYTLSAGLNPRGLVLADLNHDGHIDIGTAMERDAEPCFTVYAGMMVSSYMAARVRVFAGDGTGQFTPAAMGAPKDEVLVKPCDAPGTTPTPLKVTYRAAVEGVGALQAGIWPNETTGKFDLSLFVTGKTNGQISWLAHTTGFGFSPHKDYALGDNVKAIALRDVNFDPHLQIDVLALLGGEISFLPGAVLSDGKTGFFDSKVTLTQGAQTADWLDAGDMNADGFQDFVLLNKVTGTVEVWLGVGRSPTPLSTQFVRYPGKLRAAVDALDTELADMDNDGCIDIVVRSKRAVTVLHNEGVGCSGAMLPK
jgi:hypothetical protein